MSFHSENLSGDQAQVLLKAEETHFLDLKSTDISPSSLSKTVSAFANSSGGEIFVGIEEAVGAKGDIRIWKGFANQEAANSIIQMLEGMTPLGNHFELAFLSAEGQEGLVLQISVLKTRQILPATNGKVYVRRGAQKLPLVDDEAIRALEYDKGISSFEDEVLDIEDDVVTNSETVINFLLDVIPTSEPKTWLTKQRLLVRSCPTVAGVLLFCDEPQAILAKRSAVKIFRYKTKAEGERDQLVFQPLTIEGCAYELIFEAVRQTKEIVEGIEKLGPNGLEKVVYPEEALHEIITNAVLHRDYSVPVDAQVRIYDNRIEIESPGRLPGHITERNILNEQFARNPKLVRIINKFPDAPNKDVGEGLNTAFEAMDKLRLKPPVIQETESSVLVVLRHEGLGSPEQIVMAYLESHEEITNSIGRDLTGIRSENSMKEVFYRLRDRKMLEQVPDKRGRNAAWRKPQ